LASSHTSAKPAEAASAAKVGKKIVRGFIVNLAENYGRKRLVKRITPLPVNIAIQQTFLTRFI
jgi:hypothetical protein